MSTPPDRRSRKRLATRESISNAATMLFMERGFENVTIDEIAAAADVGRMTVFNHFPRKEDMFFDLDEEGREVLRNALLHRDRNVAPIEALRLLAHRLVSEKQRYLAFSSVGQRFIETIEASESLMARARAIRDEIAQDVKLGLAASVGRDVDDSAAYLAASLLLAVWTVAFMQAHRSFRHGQDVKEAEAVFLAFIDKGTVGVNAALAGTPYA